MAISVSCLSSQDKKGLLNFMVVTTGLQFYGIEKHHPVSFSKLLLTISFFLFFFISQISAQRNLLESSAVMFGESKMDSAAILLEQCYQYYLNQNYLDSAALALSKKAAPVAISSDITSGIDLIDQSLKLYAIQDRKSHNIEVQIYGEAVRLYSDMRNTDTVTYFLSKIEHIIESNPDSVDKRNVAYFYWDLTYAQYLKADYPSAMKTAHIAKNMFGDIYGVESQQYASALDWLGTLYKDLSQYEEAISYTIQSITLKDQNTNPSYNRAVGYNNLANIYNNISDLKNALFYNDKALDIGQRLVASGQIDKSYLFTFHSTRSATYSKMGKINEALFEFKKAEYDVKDNTDFYAVYLNSNIMQTYIKVDSLDVAKRYMAKTWSQYNGKNIGNLDDYSHFLGLEGNLDYHLGMYHSSLSKLKEAIQIRDTIFTEPEYYLTTIYETLGLAYCAMDSVSQAIKAFSSADSITRLLFNEGHESIISYNINHAECLFTHNQHIEGEQILKRMIDEVGINSTNFQDIDWSVVVMQPVVLSLLSTNLKFQMEKVDRTTNDEQKKYLVKAVDNYIEYMERYVGFFDSYSSHMSIGDDYFDTLAEVIDVLSDSENNDADAAFIFKCVQKSKTLISRMVLNDVSMDHYKGVPDSIVAQELNLRAKLNMTSKQLMDKAYKPSTGEDPFLNLEREYRQLQQLIRDQYPSYYELKYDFSVPTLKEIQSSLPKHSLFLDYFIADSFVMALSVNTHGYSFNKLSLDAVELQQLVDNLNHSILDINSNDWEQQAHELYLQLVEPLGINFDEYNQIIICPDGPLYELPMELCVDSESTGPKPILYVISADHVIPQRKSRVDEEMRILGFAPSFTHLKKTRILPQPFSRSMAEKIESRFDADIYFDQQANESTFKSLALDYPILHISTHGILDENDPLSSYLLLYEDSLNDGRLTLNELYGMHLKSHLALLNACSTSKGKFRKGAGMSSLASGFQYAGCSNLTTSLWSVDEQSNSKILTNLYDHLMKDDEPYKALFEAKKTFLATAPSELRHPYYWAGITMIGVQDPILSSGFSTYYKFLIAGILLLILFYTMILLKRTV